MAVCPAGEDLIGTYKKHRKEWVQQIVSPQKEKKEPIFVQKGTSAEEHARLNKNKEIRLVNDIIRPQTVDGFLTGARITFEPGRSKGINMTVHLSFTGREVRNATIFIKEGTIQVTDGLKEKADLVILWEIESYYVGFKMSLYSFMRRTFPIYHSISATESSLSGNSELPQLTMLWLRLVLYLRAR